MEPAEFEAALGDKSRGLVADLSGPSTTLLLAFGGMAAAIGMPPFEFLNLLGKGATKRGFVRDLDQCWYQRGVRGLAPDLPGTTKALECLIGDACVQRVVAVGTSMGGYAAILFGGLLRCDRVIAFGPQTFLTSRLRLLYRDLRWRAEIARMRAGLQDGAPLDLRPVVHAWIEEAPTTHFDIYYGESVRLDRIHARHLGGLSSVTLHPRAGSHNVARTLRDRGELAPILADAVGT